MFKTFVAGVATVTLFTGGAAIGLATQAEPPYPHVRLADRASIQGEPGSTLEGLGLAMRTIVFAAKVNAAKIAEQARLAEEARAQEVAEATYSTYPVPTTPVASAPSEGHTACAIPAYICERESGGDPTVYNQSGSGASGKYQAMPGTWGGYGGYANAADAPEEVQDQWATELWDGGAGCSHWAACSG